MCDGTRTIFTSRQRYSFFQVCAYVYVRSAPPTRTNHQGTGAHSLVYATLRSALHCSALLRYPLCVARRTP